MITPSSTTHTESYSAPESPVRHSAATAITPQSPLHQKNIHLSPSKSISEGVPLSKRILMGNKEACLTLQSIIPLDATDLRNKTDELISLIDRSRSFMPMSDAEHSRKTDLQSIVAKSVQGSVFKK
jgi:hypothetical protein